MKLLLRSGLAEHSFHLAKSEVGFNTDTQELVVGLGEGPAHVVAKVVKAEDGTLFAETPEGFLPLCIAVNGVKA